MLIWFVEGKPSAVEARSVFATGIDLCMYFSLIALRISSTEGKSGAAVGNYSSVGHSG